MKKAIFILLGVLILIIGLLAAAPFLFKDKIQQKLDELLSQQVNAQVYYDLDNLSLSIFSNFPDITAGLDEFGVINNAPFEGDTLLSVRKFRAELDIMSVISGEQIQVNGIELVKPKIAIIVLPDGSANYDIAITEGKSADTTTPSDPGSLNLAIDHWSISDAEVYYKDISSGMEAIISDLDHSGTGDFTLEEFDVKTKTTIQEITFTQGNISYLAKDKFEADVALHINQATSNYKFNDNSFKLNDFTFGLDGYFELQNDSIPYLDLTFQALDNSFKSLLSLIPAAYTEDFASLEVEGDFSLKGMAKGAIQGESIPAFEVKLEVGNGMVHYPDLPKSLENIAIDLLVKNENGLLENTIIDLKALRMAIAGDPVEAKMYVEGLGPYDLDGFIKAKTNLENVAQVLPMEGIQLKGTLDADVNAKGRFVQEPLALPSLDAVIKLENGYVKTSDMPTDVSNLTFKTMASVPGGDLSQAHVEIKPLSFIIAEEPFQAAIRVDNLENYTYDAALEGKLNLETLTKIIDLDGITLRGQVTADVVSSGSQTAIETEQYQDLSTSGTVELSNFYFAGKDLPAPVEISTAELAFDPDALNLTKLSGKSGSSDFQVDGVLRNYLAFALAENGTLAGNINLRSSKLNLNELMGESEPAPEETQTEEETEMPSSAPQVPRNLDLLVQARAGEILFQDYELKDFQGGVTLKDGIASLNNLNFKILEGEIGLRGTYDSRDTINPSSNISLNVKRMSIEEAYKTFNTIRKAAPIAENMEGDLSMTLNMRTKLLPDLSPLFPTMNGAGKVKLLDAKVTNLKTTEKIAKATGYPGIEDIDISNQTIDFEIADGRVLVEPFTVPLKGGEGKLTMVGSSGFDNTIDYDADLLIPAGAVGTAVNNALNQFLGAGTAGSDKLDIKLDITGTNDDPQVRVKSVGSAGKSAVENKLDEERKRLEQRAKQEAEKAKREAERRAREAAERARREAEEKARREKERLEREAKKKLEDEGKKLKDQLFGR